VTFVFFRKVLISSLRNEEKTHLLEASVRHFVLPTVKSTFPTPPTLLEFVIFLDSLKLYIMCILLRCTGQTWPFCFHLIFCAVFPAESMKIILDCRKENGGNASIRHRIKYPYPAALSIPFFITAYITWCIYPPPGATAPSGPGPPHYQGFTITLRHTTLGRTPLDEWSAQRRHLYMTTHSTHNRQPFMPRQDSDRQYQESRGRRPTP